MTWLAIERINIALVKEVKKHNAKKWHNQDWHEFDNRPEVEAINYALASGNADMKDILAEAIDYLRIRKQNP